MDNAQTLLAMPGVGFFGMLIIGILAGYIAEKVTSSDHGLLTNLLVGIAGSFVGGTLANVLKIEFHGWLGNLLWPRSARSSYCGSGGASGAPPQRKFGVRRHRNAARGVRRCEGAAAPSGKGAAARHGRAA